MTDDQHHDNSRTASDTERRQIEIPDTVELPRLLGFYELKQPEHTQIHKSYFSTKRSSESKDLCTRYAHGHQRQNHPRLITVSRVIIDYRQMADIEYC